MLCYGYVALFSPVSLIVSRMEATILRSITPHFPNVKVHVDADMMNIPHIIDTMKREILLV